jgi:hypothetical protein
MKWYAAQLIEPYPSVTMFEETKDELKSRGITIKDETLTVSFEQAGKDFKVSVSNGKGVVELKKGG